MQELAQAAQRRRELEQQLAKDMKQDEVRRQGELRNRQRQQRSVWQDAILALQRQRKEILRQIEQETEASRQSSPPNSPPKPASQDPSSTMGSFALPSRAPTSDPSSASIIAANHALRDRVSHQPTAEDQQYSIEGVVTLEPLASNQAQQRPPVPRNAAYEMPQSNQVAVSPPMPTKMHDTLNEVFSIQLQFAETMLKLEKSVQMREQLLNHHHSGQSRRHIRAGARRRPRPGTYAEGSRRYLDGVAEDLELDSESNSDLDYLSSSSASLDASLIRARHEDMTAVYSNQSHVAPATPPSSSTASSPPHTGSSNATTTGSSHAGISPEDNANNKTPSKKLAHGDTKTEAEMDPATKQVRFEYSTPVIAKKFTFENQSDDEESILSFLDGSSVSSSELSDPSFVRAFEKFRSDLRTAKSFLFAAAAEPGSPPLATARTLFTCDEDVEDDDEEDEVKHEEPPAAPVKARGTPAWKQQQASRPQALSAQETVSAASENAPQQAESELLDATELMELRRQLCLDIQAESAHLLLSFGSTNAPQRDRIKSTLMALRAQLQTVDTQLSQMNT